jgi:tryptophan synthase alpha chain
MNRIARTLSGSGTRPLIVPFVTAGYPEFGSTAGLVRAMAAAGADMIEIGMPFSDPLADGPTIQAASEIALAKGMTIAGVLDIVRGLRGGSGLDQVPVLLMGYCNPLFRYGLERFARDAAAAGVDGLIVPDLPPEESGEYSEACAAAGLSTVFLMAPNTPDERVRVVDAASTHFSYCVSVTGVTGARGGLGEGTVQFLERVAGIAEKPFVVGFGVKSAEQVRVLGPHAAGVVVGSALIDAMKQNSDPIAAVTDLVSELCAAARNPRRGKTLRNV